MRPLIAREWSADSATPPVPQGAAGLDLQWEAYFQNPGAYYDNRLTKPGPSSPDFKTKDRCGSPTLSRRVGRKT